MRSEYIEMLESRVLLSVARPSYNTGTGFFVLNGNVYDANGNDFVIRGINQNQWWGNPTENYNAIDHVAKTGANAVRAVFFKDLGSPPQSSGSDTPAERRSIVEKYIADNVVPIVEDHGATENENNAINDPAALAQTVDNWLDPANVSWLQQYERQVILNPSNEWGPTWSSTNHVWRDSYITQVQRLRNAGIKNLIMIDAGGWGQDMNTIRNDGQAIFDADPQHNIVFSIHFYSAWRTEDRNFDVPSAAFDIYSQLSAVRAQGLPICVGEFSWEGMDSAPYRTRRVLEICNQLNVGYMGWGWNYNSPVELNMLVDVPGGSVDYQYNSNTDLTTWGDIIVNDPDYGIKATAKRATIYAAVEPVRLILEKTTTTVPETGNGLTRVRLNKAPASNVVVSLSKVAGGDVNLNLSGGTTLTFTPSNWDQYQQIPIAATSDADTTAGTAKFQLAASGLQTVDFVAREVDSGIATGTFTLMPTQDRDTQSDVAAGTNPTVSASKWNYFFMKFDLASVGGKATSAVLRVYKTQTTSNLIGRAWFAFNDNWTQAGTAPPLSFPIVSQTMSNGVGYVDFNITSLINQELRGDRTVTLAITTNSDNWTSFNTKEAAAAFRPQLAINTIAPIPTVDIADVTPDPRPSAVNSLAISFSEPVSGLDPADLSLTRDGVAVSLAAATLSSADGGLTWTLGNLAGLSDKVGSYALTLTASGSGIVESNGYGIVANASDAWQMNTINGTAAANDVRLVRNGGLTEYFLGGALQYSFNAALLSSLNIAPGGGDDTVTLDFAGGNPLPATTSIDGGANVDTLRILGSGGADTVVFDASALTLNGATVNFTGIDNETFDGIGGGDDLSVNGGTVVLEATQRLSSLVIDTIDARIDARDHDIILDYGGPSSPLGGWDGTKYTGVLGLIAGGYNFGSFDGHGLVTTTPPAQAGVTTLAAAAAADLYGMNPGDTTLYEGQTIDATTVIIKYTYAGDANFDGVIDGGDYGIIDNFVQVPGSSAYFNGDFNYDGVIDGGDYGIIDNNIQAQGTPL